MKINTTVLILSLLGGLIGCGPAETVRSDQLKTESKQATSTAPTTRQDLQSNPISPAEPITPKDTAAPDDVVPIYRNYQITYDESSHKSQLYASFRVNGRWGAQVKLAPPSQLRLNGYKARKREISKTEAFWLGLISPIFWLSAGIGYSAEIAGLQDFHVDWTDPLGRVVRDDFRLHPYEVYLESKTFSPQEGLRVYVPSLRTEAHSDSLELRVELRQGESVRQLRTVEMGGTETGVVTFDSAQLTPGPGEIRMEQKEEVDLQNEGNKGGKAYLSYVFSPVQVNIR